MLSETFKSAEIRVAAYNDLTAEQGRALYAAYVKRGIEIDQLNAELEVYARFAEKFGDLSCCYDADDVTAVIQRAFDELKESPDTTALPYAEVKRRLEGLTRAAWRVMHHWNIFKEPSLKEVMAELSYAVQDADAQMPAQTEGDNHEP